MINWLRTNFLWATAIFLLAVGGLIYGLYLTNPIPYVPFLESRLQQEVNQMRQEASMLSTAFADQPDIKFEAAPAQLRYKHYIYQNTSVVYWSDYRYVPEYSEIATSDSLDFVPTQRHDMLVIRSQIPGTGFLLISALPLADRYEIDNRYVHSGINESLFGTPNAIITNTGEAVCIGEKCLFSVELTEPLYHKSWAIAALVLFWLGILLFSVLIFNGAIRRYSGLTGFLILLGYFVGARAVMLVFEFPQSVYPTQLFDSRYFASSAINPSMGDLFINLVCVLSIVVYIFLQLDTLLAWIDRNVSKRPPGLRFLISALLGGMLIMAFHYQYLFLQTLYNNSQLSFDINDSIQFDLLRITGLGVLVLNAAIAFISFHICLTALLHCWNKIILGPLAAGAVLFTGINLLLAQPFVVSLLVGLIFTIVIWYTGLYSELSIIRYRTFLYIFTGVLATALLGSRTIEHFESIREQEMKVRFASEFLIENDNLAEYLLGEAVKDISRDPFIQNIMSSPFMSKDQIRSKIRQKYLSNYFDKYDISIHLYNPRFTPYGIPSLYSPREIEKWRTSEFSTDYDNIYFLNRLDGQPTKRYITMIPVRRRGIVAGYIIIDMSLKRIIPDSVYPELLVDNRFLSPFQHAQFSYAVIEGRRITFNAGDFNYQKFFNPDELENEKLYTEGIERMSYNHLAVRDERGRVAIISSRDHPGSHVVSNFSFLFLMFVSLILIFSGFYAAYYYFRNIDLTYTVKIQLYLNLAFFLPLIAVSLTTLSVITSSYRLEIQDENFRKAENISRSITTGLEEYLAGRNTDPEKLSGDIALGLIGKVVGTDINLFGSNSGRLMATSQPLIYENELLSNYINPEAFKEIRENGESIYVADESVGSLTYSNTFLGIKSYESGDLLGILSIPFFQSAYELEKSQIEVLTNVMNIFTVIFIIFLFISSLASSWLTFPLKLITQRLKRTTLTGTNEPLKWKTDDEIGLMVREYNRMLENLEQSKKALARSQKETAWREIAQQVAHEIKNPLTPMKLTLQHLSRRFTNGKEELNKSIESLLAQVDTLSEIASSFSSFAKLPIPEQERFELTAVLKNTLALFDASENLKLEVDIPEGKIYSIGDEQLMGRIFSNIMLNAIQAHHEHAPSVNVTMTPVGNQKVVVEIRDFGLGIDETIQGKVFIPNFTTKEAGSGIGLAVAKHGVEHAGGKIWFETEKDVGTSFYIEMPVVP